MNNNNRMIYTKQATKSDEEQKLINGMDIKQKQFENFMEQKLEQPYNKKEEKKTSILIPYLLILGVIIALIVLAISIFINNR